MFLIIGLGNPGLKYRKTRHNIGFMVLDYWQKQAGLPRFKQNKKAKTQITAGSINEKVVFLAKPQTYMNNSGFAVKYLLKEGRLPSALQACKALGNLHSPLIVAHDDFDLPLGEVKVSQGSSSGGHKGAQSIIDALKTQNFTRVRLGIRPVNYPQGVVNLRAEDFVLKNFSKQEQALLPEIIKKSYAVIINLLKTT